MAVLKVPSAFRPRGSRVKMSSTLSGRPRSRLSATRASKKDRAWRGASNTMVREVSTCRMVRSHQNPPSRSAAESGSGSREVHRSKNTRIVPGPSRSQIVCRAAGSSAEANPLDSSVKPIPALMACRLAHSWPLTGDLDRVGEPGAELDERGAEVVVPHVHVENCDSPLLLGEGELRGLGRVGIAPAGGPHHLELLGHPDRGDLRTAGPGRPIQVGPHHLDLAVIA